MVTGGCGEGKVLTEAEADWNNLSGPNSGSDKQGLYHLAMS